ncbi:MAG TPA: SIS domain-containing protein [Mycobacteriales bacterium]|nr:SIS domain-containing protein [Mycobacteriales bacterium]
MTSLLAADIAEQAPLLGALLDRAQLGDAQRLVGSRRVVHLAGIGSSRHVAAYGAACLAAIGGHTATLLAAPGGGVPQPRLSPDDLLVLVSQSGETPALLELAEGARASGAAVLALTNAPGSPLGFLADTVLGCDAGPERVVPATKSVTTAMLLLRALAAPVPPAAVRRLALGTAAGTSPAVADAPPGFVVVGGLAGQAVADEVALKLAEVAGLPAVPESLVDFLHGPAAVVSPVVALVDDDDPNRAALAASDVQHLQWQRTGDAGLDRIAMVVAGQRFALAWADALGVDPDDPKGLAKVTLTR